MNLRIYVKVCPFLCYALLVAWWIQPFSHTPLLLRIDFGVQGFPTIKYFLDGDEKGKSYEGGRDFDSLQSFVKANLEVKCDPSTLAECSEKEQGYIKKMKAMPLEDIKKQAARLEKMAGESMKVELKMWLHQRLHILHMMGA